MYYANNIDAVKDVLDQFDEDARAIKEAKELVTSQTLKADLSRHTWPDPLMEKVRHKLGEIPGRIGEELKTKLCSVMQRNLMYYRIKTISSVLSGTTSTIPEGMSP